MIDVHVPSSTAKQLGITLTCSPCGHSGDSASCASTFSRSCVGAPVKSRQVPETLALSPVGMPVPAASPGL